MGTREVSDGKWPKSWLGWCDMGIKMVKTQQIVH